MKLGRRDRVQAVVLADLSGLPRARQSIVDQAQPASQTDRRASATGRCPNTGFSLIAREHFERMESEACDREEELVEAAATPPSTT